MTAIYLDHNATTPLAPEVLDAMLPYLRDAFGNPSSPHGFAERPATAVREARARVAALLGAQPREIHFTSGATESIHWAIQGALAMRPMQRQLITTAVEHPAVLKLCRHLEQQGIRVIYLPVDREGRLRLRYLEAALTPQTALVSLMAANNETGVLFPIEEIAALTRARGVLLHVDAAQSAGKWPLDLARTPIDLLSLSGHKLHGPKGVGALYIRNGLNLPPLFFGTQERGRRGGSLNVPGIVGLGEACRLAAAALATASAPVATLRDRLEAGIRALFPDALINGGNAERLAGTSNISFPGHDGEALVNRLDRAGIAAANGAACTVGGSQPSHVLMAMYRDAARARSAVRFSLSRYNTPEEVERVLAVLPEILSVLVPEVASGASAGG
ncbi:MAG: cysteine desulfurase family protein [Porticoccaceae bacterium]